MRFPRDLSGSDLAQSLRKLGYSVTCQTGSHPALLPTSTANIISRFPNIARFVLARSRQSLPMWLRISR